MKLTQEQLDGMLARNPSLARLNSIDMMRLRAKVGLPMIEAPAKALKIEKKEKTKKPLLNKTESLWRAELERRGHKIILVQALTFRLGDRLTYRPDLVTVEHIVFGSDKPKVMLTAYETKAPHRFKQAGITKIKSAAKQYPFIRFVLVMRDKGQWTERDIGSE